MRADPAVESPVRPRKVAAILAVSGAVVLHVIAQVSMLIARPDWSISSFRDYYASDQLSYLGIVASATFGQFDAVEPFTETGAIYYPRWYYLLLGSVAHTLGLQPTTAWALGGLAMQMLLVAGLAITCIVLSRRAWVGLLAAVPFMIGTLSWLTSNIWYTALDSHAVLWGPFAVLFPLNAEAAGLCLGALALLLLLIAQRVLVHRGPRIAVVALASVMVGVLANVQTYSFLTTIYVASFAVAAYGVVSARRRLIPLILTGLAIVAVYGVGPVLASGASPLAALVFGLLPAVPGIVVLIARTRGLAILFFALAGLAASPSILATAIGLANKDPFLVYRVASTKDLGVEWNAGLVSALVLIVPLALVFAAGIRRRNTLWIAYPAGVSAAWVVLASNDIWGANQEPYRFWIDCFVLISVTLLPMVVMVVKDFAGSRAAAQPTPRERRFALVSLAAVAVLAVASMVDWGWFYVSQSHTAMINFDTPREAAFTEIAPDASAGGLVMTDPCVDPIAVKVATGLPVVHMNLGMAWPTEYDAVLGLMAARKDGSFDLAAAARADVRWLLADNSCTVDWASEYAGSLSDPVEVEYDRGYGTETITLWKVSA